MSVVYLTVCIGSLMSATNAKVDALRSLNPRVTVVVQAVACPPSHSDDETLTDEQETAFAMVRVRR